MKEPLAQRLRPRTPLSLPLLRGGRRFERRRIRLVRGRTEGCYEGQEGAYGKPSL